MGLLVNDAKLPQNRHAHELTEASLNTAEERYFFVVSLRGSAGRLSFPVYVDCDGTRAEKAAIIDAVRYFNIQTRRNGGSLGDSEAVLSLSDAGVDPSVVPSWKSFKEKLNSDYLSHVLDKGGSAETLRLVASSLEVERNIRSLEQAVHDSSYSAGQKDDILRALDVALDAHKDAPACRPQDTDGLFHIPYSNHPICMAMRAIHAGFSASAVQATLLHDVVEDTKVTLSDLARIFDAATVGIVRNLTRLPGQSRNDFLTHIKSLDEETQAIKGLDRLDNLIRSFGIPDQAYINRMLEEDRSCYHCFFERNPFLCQYREQYLKLHDDVSSLCKA